MEVPSPISVSQSISPSPLETEGIEMTCIITQFYSEHVFNPPFHCINSLKHTNSVLVIFLLLSDSASGNIFCL